MKIFNYKSLRLAFMALSAVVIFASCDKDDDPTGPAATDTLDAKLAARTDLSLFQAAIEKSKLTYFTKGSGPFTLWAPNNAAFNAIGINNAADLNMIDSNLLVQILTYHMQAGGRSYIEIPLGPNANMTTQGGLTQYGSRKVAPAVPKAYINGIEVLEADIRASNGFIHVIQKVMFPPLLSNAQTLAANPAYARFAQAATKVLTATVYGTNPLTFLAVDNTTMLAAGYDSTSIATATGTNLTTLTNIIRYHAIPRRIFEVDLTAGPLKTLHGANVIIAGTTGNFTVKGNNNPTPFSFVNKDIVTSTGVVFSITGLLKP